MSRSTLHRATAAAAALTAVVMAAACGSDNSDTAGTDTPSGSATPNVQGRPALPTTVSSTSALLAAIDSSDPCTGQLTAGVRSIVANINFYDSEHPDGGTANITGTQSETVKGVPSCIFTINPGNTIAPTTLTVGALTAADNRITGTPTTPTSDPDNWEQTTEQSAPGIGSAGWDRVADAVTYLGSPPRVTETFTVNSTATGAFNNSGAGQIEVDGATFAAKGVTAEHTTPVDGFFVASSRPDATTTGETGRLGVIVYAWVRGDTLTPPQSFDLHASN